jgi:hypothetical protein
LLAKSSAARSDTPPTLKRIAPTNEESVELSTECTRTIAAGGGRVFWVSHAGLMSVPTRGTPVDRKPVPRRVASDTTIDQLVIDGDEVFFASSTVVNAADVSTIDSMRADGGERKRLAVGR